MARYPSLQRWAHAPSKARTVDLRKWSASQGEVRGGASGRWASHGRSRLLVSLVQKLQRPRREREALDAEARAQAAAEGLTLEASARAKSGFVGVVSAGTKYSKLNTPWMAQHPVPGCHAAQRLGVFTTAVQAALAVARHAALEAGCAAQKQSRGQAADAPAAPPALSGGLSGGRGRIAG